MHDKKYLVNPYQPKGFTTQAVNRNRCHWSYVLLLSDQHGHRMFETVHICKSSRQVEVMACTRRIKEGRPNRGGQIPTRIDVDGIPESVWQKRVNHA
jgi:hypothetical protein